MVPLILRTRSLALGFCLLAKVGFGDDCVASFVKQSLRFDLASASFGITAPTNGGFGIISAPLSPYPSLRDDPTLSWMTNATSAKYNQDFTNRVLRYGFREGPLAAIRISINSFLPGPAQIGTDEAAGERRRKELIQIQDELLKAKRSQKANPANARFRVQYGAMCSPGPESLFLMEIEITPFW